MGRHLISELITSFGFTVGDSILVIAPPFEYLKNLRVPEWNLHIFTNAHSNGLFDAVHIFALNQLDVMELAPAATAVLKKNGPLWFSFPNKTVNKTKPTDLSHLNGWDILTDSGWSINETNECLDGWSSIRFTECDF